MNDEQEIRELVTGRAAALRAGDAGTVVSAYAEQAVIFSLAPPLRQPGDPRAAEPVRRWLATFDGPIDLTVRDLNVTVGGDVAFCTA